MPLNDIYQSMRLYTSMAWPPTPRDVIEAYDEWSAWYSGDPNQLAMVYSGMLSGMPTHKGRMWGREIMDEKKVQIHVPVAGDISAKSAALLFSETPKLYIEGDTGSTTQETLEAIFEHGSMQAKLLEAAEVCSAMGGVYLKPAWDSDLLDVPFLSIAQVDSAVPEFSHGYLKNVTFWRVVFSDGNRVYRHLERYEMQGGFGTVENGLYLGSQVQLGARIDLKENVETAGLPELYVSRFKGMLAYYVPNMRPNRKWRGSPLGSSDYSGVEGLMDALDEAYTSWMRDLRLGKGRLVVPEMFIKRGKDGKPVFEEDREIYMALDVDPVTAEKAGIGITPQQFEIRTEQHAKTCLELLTRIVTGAGYSPSTFGLMGEAAPTATEVKSRERASFVTRGKKERYWRPAIEHMAQVLLAIGAEVFKLPSDDVRPKCELADSVQPDLNDVATSVNLLNSAAAASTETRVRMVHPDWSDDQVQTEVALIQKEQGALVADPTIPGNDPSVSGGDPTTTGQV